MCSSFKGDRKDSFIHTVHVWALGLEEEEAPFRRMCRRIRLNLWTWSVGRWRPLEIPRSLPSGLPCPHACITGLCRLGLLVLLNCILPLKTEECFVRLYILVPVMQRSLILPGLKHLGGGSADMTPACPVCQPLHNSHFHELSVMSSNIPASRVSLFARSVMALWNRGVI